jgi:hypothetical protein
VHLLQAAIQVCHLLRTARARLHLSFGFRLEGSGSTGIAGEKGIAVIGRKGRSDWLDEYLSTTCGDWIGFDGVEVRLMRFTVL